MVMSGNVIQHSDGPVASPVSSKKEDKEEKRIKEDKGDVTLHSLLKNLKNE